jgi:transcriptional antiterminator RfaH
MLPSETKRWYAVYSKPQKEKFAQFHLQSKGVEVFLPQLVLPQSQKRHRRVVPLFPSYLFVRINVLSGESAYVVWSPGVKYLVSFNGTPASVDDDVVDFLKERTDSNGNIQAASNLKPGQRVRVTSGPFEGLEALIEKPPDAKGRVKLLMNLLNRQVQAEIPIRFVESNWVM